MYPSQDSPPLRRIPRGAPKKLVEAAGRAIETARRALPLLAAGPPLARWGPHGVHVDVPLLYHGYAVDRVHYDPCTGSLLPKGLPRIPGCRAERPDGEEARGAVERALGEARVVEACEYRGPEDAWVVPLAWRTLIIAHLRVSGDGLEIVPDIPLTNELRRIGAPL